MTNPNVAYLERAVARQQERVEQREREVCEARDAARATLRLGGTLAGHPAQQQLARLAEAKNTLSELTDELRRAREGA